jgi:uncharacterized membrane protein
MTVGALTFTSTGPWVLAAAGGLAVCALLSLYGYMRNGGLRRGWPGLVLKFAGLILLCLVALEPQWTGQHARPGANVFAVLADNSQSMGLTDEGAGESRGARLRETLDASRAQWLATLGDSFDVRRYGFDTRLHSLDEFGKLTFDGRSSSLSTALGTLEGRFRGRPFAGVLLFTDGNATDAASLSTLSGMPPVYPVIIGGKGPARDLALGKVTVAQSAFEDAPVTVDAVPVAFGCAGEPVTVTITDKDGKVVEEQKLNAPSAGQSGSVRFQMKPEGAGLSFYRLDARLQNSGAAEATTANNSRLIVTDRGQGPYRVLYVSGRPNWEYKFLQRAVEADTQLQMTGLVRVARREPKFTFRGRAGETSNPLFRGFSDQSREAAGSYDQPVLVRLNTLDEVELRAGFPTAAEDLFKWHAVIIDDLEAAFFTTAQMTLLQKFVSERGGGVMMLGGMESFAEGAYARTPVGDMLPVYLSGANEAEALSGKPPVPLRYELDREGWLQPWARLRSTEEGERERLAGMVPFEVINRVRDVKPGASVIATVKDEKGETAPALVVQRFGLGRTAALTVGDVWRWGMKSPEARKDMERAWRQLIRWMVADVPGRVSLIAEPVAGDAAGSVKLQVRVRDAQWLPVDNATVTVEIESVIADGAAPAPLKLTAQPSDAEPGLSEATFVPRSAAAFRAKAVAVNASGAEEGRAEAGWVSDPGAAEFASLVPNRAPLEELARRTGGKVLELDELDEWAKQLPTEKAPVMETYAEPLWHTPWIFILAVACLCGEWAWRRTHGMP